MSALSEISALISGLNIPVETGVFSGPAPSTYTVLVPISDGFDLHADNEPGVDIQEVRISIFTKGSYTSVKKSITAALLDSGFTVTERRYIEYEPDTGYHHYAVDAAKYYFYESED